MQLRCYDAVTVPMKLYSVEYFAPKYRQISSLPTRAAESRPLINNLDLYAQNLPSSASVRPKMRANRSNLATFSVSSVIYMCVSHTMGETRTRFILEVRNAIQIRRETLPANNRHYESQRRARHFARFPTG